MKRLAILLPLALGACAPDLVSCANAAHLRAVAAATIATVDRVCPIAR